MFDMSVRMVSQSAYGLYFMRNLLNFRKIRIEEPFSFSQTRLQIRGDFLGQKIVFSQVFVHRTYFVTNLVSNLIWNFDARYHGNE